MSCSAPSCRACSSDISPCSADCEALPGAGAAAAGGIAACELLASCSTAAGAPASATGSANPGSAPRKHWDASSSDTPVCKQRACSGSRMMVTRAARWCSRESPGGARRADNTPSAHAAAAATSPVFLAKALEKYLQACAGPARPHGHNGVVPGSASDSQLAGLCLRGPGTSTASSRTARPIQACASRCVITSPMGLWIPLPHRPGADGAGRLGPGGRPGGELVPPRAAARR